MEMISNSQYKELFLAHLSTQVLGNNEDIQLYRLEYYLKDILMPVIPYRTTFNFIMFVTKGSMKQYLENKEYEVNENEIIFIKQGTITATVEMSDDIEGFFLAYENHILSELELPKYKSSIFLMSPYLSLDAVTFQTIHQLLVLMEQEIFLNSLEINEIIIAMLHVVLLKLLNIDYKKIPSTTTRPMELSLQFKDLLFKHHIEEKKVTFYADKLFVTENYLNKCVKDITQKKPKQWINETDINYSKALLHSSKRISEIAFELNFQTASHFTQLFKKVAGITPKEYREQIWNSQSTKNPVF